MGWWCSKSSTPYSVNKGGGMLCTAEEPRVWEVRLKAGVTGILHRGGSFLQLQLLLTIGNYKVKGAYKIIDYSND